MNDGLDFWRGMVWAFLFSVVIVLLVMAGAAYLRGCV